VREASFANNKYLHGTIEMVGIEKEGGGKEEE